MPSLPIVKTIFRELFTSERSARVTEPDLIMSDPDKVAAYTRAGREDGVMAPVYLYHGAQISSVIRPNDTVVDLGCGPATQLALVARIHPQTKFIGVDLSDEMLARARAHVDQLHLSNVEFRQEDITELASFPAQSVDAVFSTMVLHHLPDPSALSRCFAQISRILKADAGMYVADFGHLKSDKSIDYFAYQYDGIQAELFTLDYLYSLRAAFSIADFKSVTSQHLSGRASVYANPIMPFMLAVKSKPRNTPLPPEVASELDRLLRSLTADQRTDFGDLKTLYRLGGLKSLI